MAGKTSLIVQELCLQEKPLRDTSAVLSTGLGALVVHGKGPAPPGSLNMSKELQAWIGSLYQGFSTDTG